MFSVNDVVMYGTTGICRIADIRPENFCGEEKLYYVLVPFSDRHARVYCPAEGSGISIRRLLSEEEIYTLIREMPDYDMEWIENKQLRRETYSSILRSGDQRALAKLIRSLYCKREERYRSGKKFFQYDERVMRDAEKILYGEFAHVLHITPGEVPSFINKVLENNIKSQA